MINMYMENAKYSDDGSHVILNSWFNGREDTQVPVALLETVNESGLSLRDIEEALRFMRMTNGRSFEWVTMKDLVKVDLKGKTVCVYDANYEDSEWISSSAVLSVEQEDANYYTFVSDYDEDDEDSYDYYDRLSQGYSTYGTTRVLLLTPNQVS